MLERVGAEDGLHAARKERGGVLMTGTAISHLI
jgi:hypothetical protein